MKFTIIKTLGVLKSSEDANGESWQKEVNIVAWDSNDPVIDIRTWNSDHSMMHSGITLSRDEYNELKKVIADN